jgi:hypothetical protein
MPAKDKIHEAVKNALKKEDWQVTDDPLMIFIKDDNVAIDLGAEKWLFAEKGVKKIAIEVKSFTSPSLFYSFHEALGQYLNYETALEESVEERELFLAISSKVYQNLINNYVVRKSMDRFRLNIIIIDIEIQEISKWIKH